MAWVMSSGTRKECLVRAWARGRCAGMRHLYAGFFGVAQAVAEICRPDPRLSLQAMLGNRFPPADPRVPSMLTNPLFWLVAVLSVTVVGISKGGFAGLGVMGVPLLAVVMSPVKAA